MKCNGPSRTIENPANLRGRKYPKFRIPPMNTIIRDGEESSNVKYLMLILYAIFSHRKSSVCDGL